MSGPPLFPCGRVSRRGFLHQAGGGFFGIAMGALWAEAGEIQDTLPKPHLPARAKSGIFLFMCGGVSHIDTFDPKGNKWAGKLIDAVGFGDNNADMRPTGHPVPSEVHSIRPVGHAGLGLVSSRGERDR